MTTIKSPWNAFIGLLLFCGLAPGASGQVVITQKDEYAIRKLVNAFNKNIPEGWTPVPVPREQLRQTQSYRQLLEYKSKLLPYLIRQCQIEAESHVFVGSKLADREITDLEDLHRFQAERAARLKKGATPWVRWPGMFMLDDVPLESGIREELFPKTYNSANCSAFPWVQWWEDNKHAFVFETKRPIVINATYKYDDRPHISTQATGNLLTLEAASATYRQIIERAAAELGIKAFIGGQRNINHLATIRMRAVTFKEFVCLIGRRIGGDGDDFEYREVDGRYYFGGKTKPRPRIITNGWGIAMERTVFGAGEDIPVTIEARIDESIGPQDTLFSSQGRFRITDNAGNIVRYYPSEDKKGAKVAFLREEKGFAQVDLALPGNLLNPGEYNMSFKFADNETPSIAFEVYEEAL